MAAHQHQQQHHDPPEDPDSGRCQLDDLKPKNQAKSRELDRNRYVQNVMNRKLEMADDVCMLRLLIRDKERQIASQEKVIANQEKVIANQEMVISNLTKCNAKLEEDAVKATKLLQKVNRELDETYYSDYGYYDSDHDIMTHGGNYDDDHAYDRCDYDAYNQDGYHDEDVDDRDPEEGASPGANPGIEYLRNQLRRKGRWSIIGKVRAKNKQITNLNEKLASKNSDLGDFREEVAEELASKKCALDDLREELASTKDALRDEKAMSYSHRQALKEQMQTQKEQKKKLKSMVVTSIEDYRQRSQDLEDELRRQHEFEEHMAYGLYD